MPFRRESFPPSSTVPWLDREDALEEIERRVAAGELEAEHAPRLRQWARDGYLVLEGVLDADTAREINADVDAVLEANRELPIGELKKCFENLFPESAATRRAMAHPGVLEWTDRILDMRALPYQSLNLPRSSQQGVHSDEILMTTDPPGFLVAAWFALEDIADDSGPLFVLPGSHRLPYLSAAETGIPVGADEAECARIYDANYYELQQRRVEQGGFEPWTFAPARGDVLLWHSNLLHGAHAVERAGATRRSLIVHYFGERATPYSDLFQRPCDVPDLRRDLLVPRTPPGRATAPERPRRPVRR